MNVIEQIKRVFPHNICDKYFIFKDGQLTYQTYSFVSAAVIAGDDGAEVYNNHGDRVFPESDESPKYVIVHSEIGNDLTSPMTLEEANNGSQAYPAVKVRALRLGESLKSSFNDGRELRRVS